MKYQNPEWLSANDTQPVRHSGTVKWFNRMKGHGFIVPDGGGRDVFVHYEGIEGTGYKNLYKNERVTYQLIQTQKGPQARNVRAQTQR